MKLLNATVKEHLLNELTLHGLSDNEADKILISVTESDNTVSLVEVFGNEWNGYPASFQVIVWITICQFALRYIDECKPAHWARSMFTTNTTIEREDST